jgi:hypothetical protein
MSVDPTGGFQIFGNFHVEAFRDVLLERRGIKERGWYKYKL